MEDGNERIDSTNRRNKKRVNRTKTKPGFRKNFYDYIQEFTDYAGIHGIKYMGEQERSLFEKLTWTAFFLISIWLCISLIIDTWYKWETSPVLVSFARNPTPVWQIPFPAVTICPVNKAKQRAFNFTDVLNRHRSDENVTDEELKRLADSSLICDDYRYDDGNRTTGYDTIDFLSGIAPQFQDVLFSCKWTLLNESCYNLFTPILTEDGLCFTFNMLDREELFRNNVMAYKDYMSHDRNTEGWTLEEGYPSTAKKDTFPRRAMSAGSSAGLFLLITAYQQDLDYICKGPVQGFKIILHHPAEIPRMTHYYRVPLNEELVMSINPDMMTTSPGLRNYDAHRRQCYFPDEKHLTFFRYYTQQNCQVECLTNYTSAKCGCVAYHMPHDESTPICGAGSVNCMSEAEADLLEREIDAEISNFESENFEKLNFSCDCLPACTSLTYNAEMTQADFKWQKIFEGYRSSIDEFPGIQMSRLTLYFKEQQFITSERNELYGLTDFLANCGGILGLFIGFSFLSIVEVFYFLTLRLVCNVKIYGRRYWSGSSNLMKQYGNAHD